jgi:hypothetical protein
MLCKCFITVIARRVRNNDWQVVILFHGVVEYFTQINACDLNKTHGAGAFMAWAFSFILMCCDCCCFCRLCKNNLNITAAAPFVFLTCATFITHSERNPYY